MSASITDKITDVRNAARPNSARASGTRAAAGLTLACDNLSGWPTTSKAHFVTYRVDSSSKQVAGTQLDCYGIVSGNSITSFTVVDGTDLGNSVGDYVEMLPTAAWGQDLADALMLQHTRTGAHGAVTASSLITTGDVSVGGNLSVPTSSTPFVVPASLAAGAGTSWAWQSWTPTWATLTVGNAVQACKYVQIGKTIICKIDVVLGSTSAMGTGKATFTLPVTAISATANLAMSTARYNAGGVLALGQVQLSDTTHGQLCDFLANGTYVTEDQFTSAAPGTWATNSTITATFAYEAA